MNQANPLDAAGDRITSVAYRTATVSDASEIARLGQELNRLHHEAHPMVFSDPDTEEAGAVEHWSHWLTSPSSTILAAFRSDTLLGFLAARVDQDQDPFLRPCKVCRIGSICVTEAERGQGIGASLMRNAERWAATRGATDIRLNVWNFNEAAVRLYGELGYEVRMLQMGRRLGPPEQS